MIPIATKITKLDLHVRLPADVYFNLRTAAEANERSLNAEIIARLRASFSAYRR